MFSLNKAVEDLPDFSTMDCQSHDWLQLYRILAKELEVLRKIHLPERVDCTHCGLRVYFDRTSMPGVTWRHHESNFVECHGGLITNAEPRFALENALFRMQNAAIDLVEQLKNSESKFTAHTKVVSDFLREMHAIMIDPVEDANINVVQMCNTLLVAAQRSLEDAGKLGELQVELGAIDAALARRPALDGLSNRYAKIERMCHIAGQMDKATQFKSVKAGQVPDIGIAVLVPLNGRMWEVYRDPVSSRNIGGAWTWHRDGHGNGYFGEPSTIDLWREMPVSPEP